ncbi:KRI1 [Lepeophtheirus salmonis]|uniref:Protein KRI1 homolog n=1 Tax=Lepeophtheirus salmonis TaxID=72036 RepID=A0A7R8D0Q7_LEPSM|nr:KRI1 [Lepeophtheirus salmonis]CAF2986836.1 KRI1 [Lepeophtheirus salmonis]
MTKNEGKFEEIPNVSEKGYYEELDEIKEKLKGLKEFWSRRDLDSNEKFLRDYILKEKYKDQGGDEDSEEEEVEEDIDDRIHDSDDNLSEDEKTVEKMEEFETKFNFRFEEPDPDFIKRYPRTIEDSMRKKDESRTEDVNFEEEDLEEDFDPESYDKRMKEIFKNYDDNVVDEDKPVFPDIGDSDIENDLEVENWDDWKPSQEHDVQNNDEEGDSMTVNEEKDDKYTFQKEVLSTLGRRKGKRKSKFAEIIEKKKPIFDSKMNKTFENYLNEYYKLDCEDIIGDLPCRFKYRNVQKNAFGLEVEEILSAPDRELNAWCSLKKTCQYRDERDEKADVVSYENKRGNIQLKEKILPSLFVSNSEENLEAERMKKSQKSKRNRKNLSKEKNQVDMEKKTTDSQEESNTDVKQNKSTVIQNNSIATTSSKAQGLNTETSKNNRKRKRNKNFTKQATSGAKNININAEIQMSDQRLEAYGLAPGKFKRKIRQKKFNKD